MLYLISYFQQLADDVKDSKSEFTNIQNHKDEMLKELDKVKQEQDAIEKTCLNLCALKDNVIINIIIVYYFFRNVIVI